MKVELVSYTLKRTPNTKKVLVGSLRHRLASGHESVSEHASFTFAIEGVSRELTHQLVRYGIASYSQHSQRHVKTDGFDYVIPESIKVASETELMNGGGWHTNGCIHDALDHYRIALDDLIKRLRDVGIPEEDIRYFYPNASYSQESQRYTKMDGFVCVTPKTIFESEEKVWDVQLQAEVPLEVLYSSLIKYIGKWYKELISLGIPEEDARQILPNACTPKTVVKMDGFDYVIPDSIRNHEKTWDENGKTDVEKWYRNAMEGSSEFYVELIEAGIPEEDARYILPNAYTTNIVVKMDARELRHFFKSSCCTRAQWEIREMANLMLEKVKEVAPMLFKDVGASCVATGRCSEGKKSCGRVKE